MLNKYIKNFKQFSNSTFIIINEYNSIHRNIILDNQEKFTIAYEMELKSTKAFNSFEALDNDFRKTYGNIIKKYDMVTEYDYTIDESFEYDFDIDVNDTIPYDTESIETRVKGIEMKNKKYFNGISEAFNFLDDFYDISDNKYKQTVSTGTHINIGYYKKVPYNILKGYLLLNEDFTFKRFENRKGSKYTGSFRNIFYSEAREYFMTRYNKIPNHLDIKRDFTIFEADLNEVLINILKRIDEKIIGFNFNKLKENYIEFRYPGGRLTKDVLKYQTLHYCNIIYLCCNPEYRKKDYIIKLTNFITNL